MKRKSSKRPAHRPRSKHFDWNAIPDYPLVIWPFGIDGANGFVVEYPDLESVEPVSELELSSAISAAQDGLRLARKIRGFRKFAGRSRIGVPPAPPMKKLTQLQLTAALIEADARVERRRAKRRARSHFGWSLSPEELLAKLADLGIGEDRLPDSRTIARWRSDPAYSSAVLAASRDIDDKEV